MNETFLFLFHFIFCIVENMFSVIFLLSNEFSICFSSLIQFGNACLYLQLTQACISEVFTVIANLGIAIVANGNLFCPL